MKYHSFFKDYHTLDHVTNDEAPELRFMRHVCQGGTDISEFFHEKTYSRREVVVHTPYDDFVGHDAIGLFAREFLGKVGASSAEIHPVIQTVASGRSVTEAEVWFDIGEEEPYKVPMNFFCDLGTNGKMEGLRIYYFLKWIPGTPAYFKPIFIPKHNEPTDTNHLSGFMKFYAEQINNFCKEDQLENILGMFADEPRVGGYRPQEITPRTIYTKEKLRAKYTTIVENIPKTLYIRFECITDDGRNCLAEWTSIIRKEGLARGFVSQAGMAAYERDENGKLVSVRICDNFRFDDEIDLSTVDPALNFVE